MSFAHGPSGDDDPLAFETVLSAWKKLVCLFFQIFHYYIQLVRKTQTLSHFLNTQSQQDVNSAQKT